MSCYVKIDFYSPASPIKTFTVFRLTWRRRKLLSQLTGRTASWKPLPRRTQMCHRFSRNCWPKPKSSITWALRCGRDAGSPYPGTRFRKDLPRRPPTPPRPSPHPHSCSICSRYSSAKVAARGTHVFSRKVNSQSEGFLLLVMIS